MKRVLQVVAAAFGVGVLVVGAFLGWVWMASTNHATQAWSIPDASVPVPWPLDESEAAAARFEASFQENADLDAAVAARAEKRALQRGRHLVETRLGCAECHGRDLGGKVVMDVPPVGGLIAPNLTAGEGSVTQGYTIADWIRILRHGVGRDGQASQMPAIDTAWLSDQEISDIVAYVQSRPPVDRTMPPSYLGPVMRVQIATGGAALSAHEIDHEAPRREVPPPAGPTVEYGEHLAYTCSGCHGMGYGGGPIPGGDPSWPDPPNLTPHETGLAGWTWSEFDAALRKGVGKDGRGLNPVMPFAMLSNLSEVESRAMFAYFQSLDPKPMGSR